MIFVTSPKEARVREALPNKALHRIAPRWQFGMKPKGRGWAARGERRALAPEVECLVPSQLATGEERT
jgi:hypothetical protein